MCPGQNHVRDELMDGVITGKSLHTRWDWGEFPRWSGKLLFQGSSAGSTCTKLVEPSGGTTLVEPTGGTHWWSWFPFTNQLAWSRQTFNAEGFSRETWEQGPSMPVGATQDVTRRM